MKLKLDQRQDRHKLDRQKLERHKIEQTRFHEHTHCRLNSFYLSIPFQRILSQSFSHTHHKTRFNLST